MQDKIYHGDGIEGVKSLEKSSVDLILSDIPYGIGYEDWDVLHNNTNSALLGQSPAQAEAGKIFKHRGKPLNGWSEADKNISKEYYQWCSNWAPDWYEVLKAGGSAFVFAGRRLAPRCICALEDAGFIFKDMLCWKKSVAPWRAQRVSCTFKRRNNEEMAFKWSDWRAGNLRPIFEPILWFMKPYKIGGTLADNLIDNQLGCFNEQAFKKRNMSCDNYIEVEHKSTDHGLHPTQKPLALMELLIELTTITNQVVLDPFAGSGTTLLAAKNLNRHYIGYEIAEEYYQICQKRLEHPVITKNAYKMSMEQLSMALI